MTQSLQDSLAIFSIDDCPTDTDVLRRNLKRVEQFQYTLQTALDPEEGLAELAKQQYDVVILDYQMGRVTGLDLIPRVRKLQPTAAIIFLSGHGSEEIAVSAFKAGASDYLPKGRVLPTSLKRTINNAVEKERLRFQVSKYQEDLEHTVCKLQTKNEEIKGFYHVLSHELKTPLTAIREFVSIVIDGLAGEVNEEQKEYLHVAMRNCDRLRVLLNDILDVTRIETGKLTMNFNDYDAGDMLKAAILVQQSEAATRNIDLSLDVNGLPGRMNGDEGRIGQVLTNLLTNALKFTPKGGSISVTAGTQQTGSDDLVVCVTDTGCGIDPERLPKVFERLYQVREEDFAIEGGLGLGLNIAMEIIRAHGGDLWATSELGQGSQFSFSLPQSTSPAVRLSA
jgi:signal transduction histidine kinase